LWPFLRSSDHVHSTVTLLVAIKVHLDAPGCFGLRMKYSSGL
jgi:hypothetical protein